MKYTLKEVSALSDKIWEASDISLILEKDFPEDPTKLDIETIASRMKFLTNREHSILKKILEEFKINMRNSIK